MMLDKNGVELRTGCVVEITGAYFKNDNGLYFVDRSPGVPSWIGRDYSLKKISKTGKISKAKHNQAQHLLLAHRNFHQRPLQGSRGPSLERGTRPN